MVSVVLRQKNANKTCPMLKNAEFAQVKKDMKETLMRQNAAIAKKKLKSPKPCAMTSNKQKSSNKAEKGKVKRKQKIKLAKLNSNNVVVIIIFVK